MKRLFCLCLTMMVVALSLTGVQQAANAGVVTFGDLSFAPGFVYEHGAHVPGSFTSSGVVFNNTYFPPDPAFPQFGDYWAGFGYSSQQPNLAGSGFDNQYNAITGPSHGNYGIAHASDFDPLPSITLPTGASIVGANFTNSTYAYLSMKYGDAFAKNFGGVSGNDADWFMLTIHAIDASGNLLPNSIDFYLADYRFADNSKDYIVKDWQFVDLSSLVGAKTIYFTVSSSDVGQFGMNTPAYFAIDDIQFNDASSPVPEPASVVILAGGGLGLALARAMGRKRNA